MIVLPSRCPPGSEVLIFITAILTLYQHKLSVNTLDLETVFRFDEVSDIRDFNSPVPKFNACCVFAPFLFQLGEKI